MTVICQYCQKSYLNKYTLKHHQKTAKKCLRIQQKSTTGSHKCIGCAKAFTRKDSYTIHIKQCDKYIAHIADIAHAYIEQVEIQLSEEYEWQVMEKDEEIARLRARVRELEARPTTINNIDNSTNIYQWVEFYGDKIQNSLTQETVESKLPTLCLENLQSPQNLAVWVARAFENIVFCTDSSRKKFVYRNGIDKLIKDPRFQKGLIIIFSTIADKARAHITEYLEELQSTPKYNHQTILKMKQILTMIVSIGEGKIVDSRALSTFLSALSRHTYLPMVAN